MEGKTRKRQPAKAGMSVRSAPKWEWAIVRRRNRSIGGALGRIPSTGCGRKIEPLLRNDPTGKLKADNYRLASRAASRAVQASHADAATTITGHWRALQGRIRRCTSPRCIRRDGRPSSTFTHCGELKVTIAGQSYAVPADTQPLGMAYAEVAGRDLPGVAAGIGNATSGLWAAFQRWCAATILG